MPQFKDSRGLDWTAGSAEAAQALFHAINRFLTYRADAMQSVEAVLDLDPDCPGARTLQGFLFLFGRGQSLRAKARTALAGAEAQARAATPRERMHIAALARWVAGDLRGAQRVLDDIVTAHPHDVLALRLQHVNAIFFGRPDVLRLSVTRALGDWDDGVPGAGFVYGMACMGLEEVGVYRRAETFGRRGAELEPDDLWSVHSVAHVMEAQGRLDDGVA